MNPSQVSTGVVAQSGATPPLSTVRPCSSFERLEIDTCEALAIEQWLERKTMKRLDALTEYNFWQEMEGMPNMPVQSWEVMLPFSSEIMGELVAVTHLEDTVLERVWV